MNVKVLKVILTCIFIFMSSHAVCSHELKAGYITVIYANENQLRRFNKEIKLGSLSYLWTNKKSVTADDEIKDKLDAIVERVESILEMFPRDLKFTIALFSSDEAVQSVFKNRYGRHADYIAFYSPKDKTIFVSIKNIELEVLAHEIAHVIIDFYYGIPTPTKIHEILAQYVEIHLRD